VKTVLTGFDANSFIIQYARDNSHKFPEIQYRDENIFSENFKKTKFDIVNATLFLHHFTNEELKEILTSLKRQTKYAIIINDLHRHWLAYHSIKILTQLFSKSSMVKYDSKLSVRRGFRKKELEDLIKGVGFRKFSIKWKWAFRYQIILWV
jgi:2-polyprenyl-3-methyl-5-hydroxy-6-metoxy-1,4-benzoquinol methylase